MDQRRLCTDWMTTAVRQLPPSQTYGLNRVELRSRRALSRVSLPVLPHFGFRSAAAPGTCRSRLLGKPEL